MCMSSWSNAWRAEGEEVNADNKSEQRVILSELTPPRICLLLCLQLPGQSSGQNKKNPQRPDIIFISNLVLNQAWLWHEFEHLNVIWSNANNLFEWHSRVCYRLQCPKTDLSFCNLASAICLIWWSLNDNIMIILYEDHHMTLRRSSRWQQGPNIDLSFCYWTELPSV